MVSRSHWSVETAGLSMRPRTDLVVAVLRYFNAAEELPPSVAEVVGGALPAPLQAIAYTAGGSALTLAWRTPTETLLLCADGAVFEALAQRVNAASAWGCFVDQTGGLTVWEITGGRTRDLLERLGSAASMPQLGEARTSRMADLSVLALRLDEAATLLVVDRLYAQHLLGWVEEIIADF